MLKFMGNVMNSHFSDDSVQATKEFPATRINVMQNHTGFTKDPGNNQQAECSRQAMKGVECRAVFVCQQDPFISRHFLRIRTENCHHSMVHGDGVVIPDKAASGWLIVVNVV